MSPRTPRSSSTDVRERPQVPAKTTRAAPPRASTAPRRLRRSTKVWLSVGLVITLLAVGAQWTLRQSLFRVQHVYVVGAQHESSSQILAATGLGQRPTMLSVSSSNVAADLNVFPWIERVSVTKHWPNTVDIVVHESTPVAVAFTTSGQLRFVSDSGRDLGPAPLHVDLPTLTYLRPLATSWPFARAGEPAAMVASELPPAFSAQVSSITVNASGDVTLNMTTPVTFELGAAVNLHEKFVAIASVIAHSTLRPGDVVDVSVPDELAVTGPAPS